MKRIYPFVLGIVFMMTASCLAQGAVLYQDAQTEKQVNKLLGRMTLEEKIGQMMQLESSQLGAKDAQGVFHIDPSKCDTLLGIYKIGSMLNPPCGVALTAAEWQKFLEEIQKQSMKHIGIPCLFGLDQNHGATYTQGSTLFPQNINVAATFNRQLAQQCSEVTAYETRACSVPWTFCPTMDLGRDARWARLWENFGEDSYLNAEMGRQQTLGFQGAPASSGSPAAIDQQHIAACLKHYMGYGVPRSGKDRTPAYISPAELREKHFAPFLACLREGAASVMVNSASVNGMPVHANYELLTVWLKEQTGWDGVVITDWADVNNLYTRECVAKDKKDALRVAINAGIDMVMEPYDTHACTLMKELVEEGLIPMSRIDDAVRRVLRLKYRLGLFEHPTQSLKDFPKLGGAEFAQLAIQGAAESMVLLKNEILTIKDEKWAEPLLPLKKGTKILVTGPNANQMRCLNGAWSYTWQGERTDEFTQHHNTIYEALCNEYGQERVTLCQGVVYNEQGKYWEEVVDSGSPAVLQALAANCDVIVACIGENSYCETPGNLSDLRLSENQRNLVKALAKTGKPIVLVLNEGRPRIIKDIEPLATAIVDIMLPGNYGGDALAGLLSGRYNFSGRLPFTYPSETASLANYDYKKSEEVGTMEGAYNYDARITCQWPFGYGLSYTTFDYSNLRIDRTHFTKDDVLTVSVDVTNSGDVAGSHSVLLYSSDLIASMTPDGRRLRQFEKITLQPHETRTVTFQLPASDLAFVGYDGRWTLEEGDFLLTIGKEQVKVTCDKTFSWSTPNK